MKGVVTNIIRKRSNVVTKDDKQLDQGGYFFIRDENEQDRFAHARDLKETRFEELREKDPVEFEASSHPSKGLRATRVTVVRA